MRSLRIRREIFRTPVGIVSPTGDLSHTSWNLVSPMGDHSHTGRDLASPTWDLSHTCRNLASPIGDLSLAGRNLASPMGYLSHADRNLASPTGDWATGRLVVGLVIYWDNIRHKSCILLRSVTSKASCLLIQTWLRLKTTLKVVGARWDGCPIHPHYNGPWNVFIRTRDLQSRTIRRRLRSVNCISLRRGGVAASASDFRLDGQRNGGLV